MQVFCKSTSGNAEVHCCICGQGFVLFWERQSRSERSGVLLEIQKTLRGHHQAKPGPEAHPQSGFLIPELGGPVAFSGAAIPGHAPTWAL
jgi:hypothetical protein